MQTNCTVNMFATHVRTHYYSEHAHKLASQHGACCSFPAFSYPDLTCFTPVAPAAIVSETILDLPVILQAVPGSRKCAKTSRGELQLICILAFSRHNFRTEGFFENPPIKIQEEPKRNLVSTDADARK